jgi:hypothetical protein
MIKKILINTETINSECPKEAPLLDKNSGSCVYDSYDESINEISNSIIKIQWLNKINQIGEIKTWFIGTDFSSEGDLIIQSFIYDGDVVILERYFYGIKNNGRALFYNEENGFTNQILINSSSTAFKFESEFIRIKLNNDDGKDYYLS